jgi:hypothetical protein
VYLARLIGPVYAAAERGGDRVAGEGLESLGLTAPEGLERGGLVEVEVELETEPIFHLGAVMSGFLDMARENPKLFGVAEGALGEFTAMNRILDKLLGGLIPVRGRVVDLYVVDFDGKEWIAHRTLLSQLPHTLIRRPLYLTGVAEQSLFWKDIRRVLFSGSRYRVLARLAADGIQSDWTPVKLVDVLRTVAPGVAASIKSVNASVLDAMSGAEALEGTQTQAMIRSALTAYVGELAEAAGTTVNPEDAAAAADAAVTSIDVRSFGSVAVRRQAFAYMEPVVEHSLGRAIDRAKAAECRGTALAAAGFTPDGQPVARPASRLAPDRLRPGGERFLDSELIAIYW